MLFYSILQQEISIEEVVEWFKALVCYTSVLFIKNHGFDSHPFRYNLNFNNGYPLMVNGLPSKQKL